MKIGIPLETQRHEHRVGLTPFGVSRLHNLGCEVFVQHDAGRDCHFADRDFVNAGGQTVYDSDEIYGRADLVCKVGPVTPEEAEQLRPGSIVTGFMHVGVMPKATLERIVAREITLIGWEAVEDAVGSHPVLRPLSEIAGHLTIHWAAHLLQHEAGGRGIVLGNIPGIAPATVVVLGAGIAGWTAARAALALHAHVIVMDADLNQLRHAMEHGCAHAVTAVASPRNLQRFIPIADVVIGAAHVPRGRAPFLVSETMVKAMKPGSVILDIAIDEGGCVETSRPTSLDNPVFKVHGVTHFCVPNMTANAPRAASRAFALASVPYLCRIADDGLEAAARDDPGFARGIATHRGRVFSELAAATLGVPRDDSRGLAG
jgi:alanine dehydrogenase